MKPAKPQMDVCSSCRKLYPRVYVRLCGVCAADENLRFELVRTFLAQAGTTAVGIPEIVDWTGLSRGDVVRFYEQGRLVDIDPGLGGKPGACTCAPGASTRCPYCRMQMADGMRSQLDNPDARRSIGESAGTLAPAPAARGRSGGTPGGAPRAARPAAERGGFAESRPAAASGGGSVSPLRGGGDDTPARPANADDDGRVQYVRRIRRSS